MKLIIDSEKVEITSETAHSLDAVCREVMNLLLPKNRSIASCAIDGKLYGTISEAANAFQQARSVEFTSMPLKNALIAMGQDHLVELALAEQMCETLVTDSLLAEPEEIVRQWSDLCNKIKERIGVMGRLGVALPEDEINILVDQYYAALNSAMENLAEVFSKGDIVGFSDALETQLLPWLKDIQVFSKKITTNLEALVVA